MGLSVSQENGAFLGMEDPVPSSSGPSRDQLTRRGPGWGEEGEQLARVPVCVCACERESVMSV